MENDRFWSKVQPAGDCWEWQAARMPTGYGRFKLNGSTQYAHRVSWELVHGPIPEDTCVLHKCDNPCCVKPGHLFLGSRADNMADKVAKDRQVKGSDQPTAKLTEEAVLEIRERYAGGGVSQRQLAREHKVSQERIFRVIHHQAWAHVGP